MLSLGCLQRPCATCCGLTKTGVAMPKIKYGILDDFGDVIRWQWNKPSSNYRYITKRLNVDPVINWNDFEPALF